MLKFSKTINVISLQFKKINGSRVFSVIEHSLNWLVQENVKTYATRVKYLFC